MTGLITLLSLISLLENKNITNKNIFHTEGWMDGSNVDHKVKFVLIF